MKKQVLSNWVNAGIILVVLVLAYFLLPRYAPKVVGLTLPVHAPQVVTDRNILVYQHLPAQYHLVARINLERHFLGGEDASVAQSNMLKTALVMAKKVKANGLVLTIFGHSVGGPGGLMIYQLQALAIQQG